MNLTPKEDQIQIRWTTMNDHHTCLVEMFSIRDWNVRTVIFGKAKLAGIGVQTL